MSKNNKKDNKDSSGMKMMIAIFIGAAIVLGAIVFTGKSGDKSSDNVPANNVTMESGKQVIAINVKGGYSPKVSAAKAGIPTILRFNTSGAFDCSSSLYLPSMNYRSNLPLSGTTDIDLGSQPVGTFRGMCGMGMYNFSVNFK